MLTWMKHIDIQIDRHTKWRSGRWTICVRCLRAIHTYRVIYMRTFVIAVCCPKNHSNSIHIFSMLTTANRPIRVSDEAQETADWSKSAIHRGNQYLFHRLDGPSRNGGLNVPLCLHRPLLPCCLQSWRCNCTNLFASWRRTLYRDDPCDATIDCRTWYEQVGPFLSKLPVSFHVIAVMTIHQPHIIVYFFVSTYCIHPGSAATLSSEALFGLVAASIVTDVPIDATPSLAPTATPTFVPTSASEFQISREGDAVFQLVLAQPMLNTVAGLWNALIITALHLWSWL